MKRKPKSYSIGNGWKRTKTASGKFRYFHKGKPVSEKKFGSAAKRIRNTRKKRAEKETNELRRKLKLPPLKKRKQKKQLPPKPTTVKKRQPYALCRVKDRQAFYEEIKKDRERLRKKISEEDFSALRVIIDIDPTRRKKRDKRRRSQQGFRSFRDLRKLKNFLGLNYSYNGEELREPVDWSKRGACKYQKRAYQSVVQLRGERVIGEKILRRYEIEQP